MVATLVAIALACAGGALGMQALDPSWAKAHQWLIPVLWAGFGVAGIAAIMSSRWFRSLYQRMNVAEEEGTQEATKQETHGARSPAAMTQGPHSQLYNAQEMHFHGTGMPPAMHPPPLGTSASVPTEPLYGGDPLPPSAYSSHLTPLPVNELTEAECRMEWLPASTPKKLWAFVWNGTPASSLCTVRLGNVQRWSKRLGSFIDTSPNSIGFYNFRVFHGLVAPETSARSVELVRNEATYFSILGLERDRTCIGTEIGAWRCSLVITLGERQRHQYLYFDWSEAGLRVLPNGSAQEVPRATDQIATKTTAHRQTGTGPQVYVSWKRAVGYTGTVVQNRGDADALSVGIKPVDKEHGTVTVNAIDLIGIGIPPLPFPLISTSKEDGTIGDIKDIIRPYAEGQIITIAFTLVWIDHQGWAYERDVAVIGSHGSFWDIGADPQVKNEPIRITQPEQPLG